MQAVLPAADMPVRTVQLLIGTLIPAAIFLCGTLGLSKGNIVCQNFHAVVLYTILVGVVIVSQTAFHNDHTALVEIAADKLCLLPPAADVDKISFPFAGLLIRKTTIDRQTNAANCNTARRLPEIRIRTQPSHQNYFVQHVVPLSEIRLTLR